MHAKYPGIGLIHLTLLWEIKKKQGIDPILKWETIKKCCKYKAGDRYYLLCMDFDSTYRGKMKQILLSDSLPKETIAAIMMLYKNMKVKVCSPDGDTDYFDIVAGVLQGDTLAPYLFIICLDYMLRTSIDIMKDNSFKLANERSRRHPAQTIMDADYADDIVNTPTRAKTLLHSLEQAATGIGLHVNTEIMQYVWFNQRGNISTLNGSSLKLVDKLFVHNQLISEKYSCIKKQFICQKIAKAQLLVTHFRLILY